MRIKGVATEQKSVFHFSKRTVALFCVLAAPFSYAFQSNFISDDSLTPTADPPQYDERFFANAPYSMCEADGIPIDWCLKIGLNLWRPIFLDHNINESFITDYAYDINTQEVATNKIQRIVDNYYIPPFKYKSYDVPTEGQLVWMFDNGYVTKGPKFTKYFVRESATGEYKHAVLGVGFRASNDKAKLPRLVTSEVPDVCDGFECSDFVDTRTYTMVFDSACGTAWNWRIKATGADGQSIAFSHSGEGKLEVPGNLQNIDVGMRTIVSSYAWRRSVNLTDRAPWTENECYRLGSCTGYSILHNFTTSVCDAKAERITKTYNIDGACIRYCR